jgi:diketogulonate reductase-like aldo/keto reductase
MLRVWSCHPHISSPFAVLGLGTWRAGKGQVKEAVKTAIRLGCVDDPYHSHHAAMHSFRMQHWVICCALLAAIDDTTFNVRQEAQEGPTIILPSTKTASLTVVEPIRYRHIDTAQGYGNHREIGEALAELIQAGEVTREDVFITTKVTNQSAVLY